MAGAATEAPQSGGRSRARGDAGFGFQPGQPGRSDLHNKKVSFDFEIILGVFSIAQVSYPLLEEKCQVCIVRTEMFSQTSS